MTRYLYLHGFASGPLSRKAQFFRERLAALGIPLEIPALDQDDFEHLTLSSQLSLISDILRNEANGHRPVVLIGSSMGGYLAALYAAKHPAVKRMVLLAPAFGFGSRWIQMFGEERVSQWRSAGYADVYHYGAKALRPLSAALLDDATLYPEFPACAQPSLVFHGRNDTVVPIEASERWTAENPAAQLTPLDSDHELLNVLEDIWLQAEPFLLG